MDTSFVDLVRDTLKRIEDRNVDMDRKIDDLGGSVAKIDSRLSKFESRAAERLERTKTFLPMALSGSIGLAGLITAIFKH